MNILPNLLFISLLTAAVAFAVKNFSRIYANIHLGRKEDRSGNISERLRLMALVSFGQKKMFDRPLPAILHLFVYLGFLIVNIEMLEIVFDGIFGTHRAFASLLGSFYPFIINVFEFFAVSVIIACVVFLLRRNVVKVKRFNQSELKKWPFMDANIILVVEILLMGAFLKMNSIDQVLSERNFSHYESHGIYMFSSFLMPIFSSFSSENLEVMERLAWWFHIVGVLIFLNYLPFSKHLHIMLAFPNTYFSKLNPVGVISNMPEVTKEVKLMLSLPVDESVNYDVKRFGAKDATDLTQFNLLNAYTCTECGRCTSVCPANITGKSLSPRKIMMDTRDRIEEIGRNIEKNDSFVDDGKSLLGDYITHEEILACTTCNACVDACPVNINPLDIIVQLRRFKVMEESQAPQSWNMMFQNMETSMAPWKFSPSDRFNWSDKV
ncbi:MAG: (Fe-S)-binding protein [Bacteroidota bacterium]|nr:(Fe-S)-binding protein [Bacteroidota bacterium]